MKPIIKTRKKDLLINNGNYLDMRYLGKKDDLIITYNYSNEKSKELYKRITSLIYRLRDEYLLDICLFRLSYNLKPTMENIKNEIPEYYTPIIAKLKNKELKYLWCAVSDNGEFVFTEYNTDFIFRIEDIESWIYDNNFKK